MNISKRTYWLSAALTCLSAGFFAAQAFTTGANAQQPSRAPTAPNFPVSPTDFQAAMAHNALQPHSAVAGPPSVYGVYSYPNTSPMSEEEAKQEREDGKRLAGLLNQLRRSQDVDEKSELKGQVSKLLSDQLDRDLARREQSLQEIERRAAELRTQLEARRENKTQTLELLLMLAENPSAGLGIPQQWMQSFGIQADAYISRFAPAEVYAPRANQPSENPFGYPQPAVRNTDPNAADPFAK